MAQDTLKVFGTTYTGVTGFIASDGNNGTKTFIRPEGTLYCDDSGSWNCYEAETFVVPAGSEGTPSATKGSVSNHSISVTPSVTNGEGWISGGSKTGTAVTVSASELVSGSQTITQNGTVDVTTLAQVIVSVAGGGGSGLVYETGTWSPGSDTARGSISFANSHTESPIFIMLADMTGTTNGTTYTNYAYAYCDLYKMWGSGIPYSQSQNSRYGFSVSVHRATSTSQTTTGVVQIQYNSDNAGSSSSAYARYNATSTEFHPHSNSTSRYWRAGRTYKWIAVWKPST